MQVTAPDVYPANYVEKIGFDEVRRRTAQLCQSQQGQEIVLQLEASSQPLEVVRMHKQVRELIGLLADGRSLPSLALEDCRESLLTLKVAGTFLEVESLVHLLDMLRTLHGYRRLLTEDATSGSRQDESLLYVYPELAQLFLDVHSFPQIEQHLSQLLDKEGRLKDSASKALYTLRRELEQVERSLSTIMSRILRHARAEGWVGEDTQPAIRDGRLVIPLEPQYKRNIRGVVHDSSSTGKTVYVEPVEMVEANNRLRELEAEERKEVVRILKEVASRLRPNVQHLCLAYDLLAYMDTLRARALWAELVRGICPMIEDRPCLEWHRAMHPLLYLSHQASGKEVVPLDINLDEDEGRIVLISGPNAGGKSVCLKSVGLLQYMLQAGFPVPMSEASRCGVFSSFFIDIGDEQSIDDDLSTYSSHLRNMKHFVRQSRAGTMLLIDEFGGGTEPIIGGAIAQAVLEELVASGAYGVITTHYQRLKDYAEATKGISNAAMLYDRREMRPLFQLSIGRPGSSFAIEIARKIGLPERVIERAKEQVGADYVDMDKYLQDIVRDKRYWEEKRQSIRREEKRLLATNERYQGELEETERMRKAILTEARAEARKLIAEAGKQIERTIREIKEANAERERTQSLRASLRHWERGLEEEPEMLSPSPKNNRAEKELEKLLRRRERKARQVQNDQGQVGKQTSPKVLERPAAGQMSDVGQLSVGDEVYIQGQKTLTTILQISKGRATISAGSIRMEVPLEQLRRATASEVLNSRSQQARQGGATLGVSVIDAIRDKRMNFRTDLDVRGMRATEAVSSVATFVDDALQLGLSPLRVLHGTGTGALRDAIRQYLSTQVGVRHFHDEHVQLGGAGITVIELD